MNSLVNVAKTEFGFDSTMNKSHNCDAYIFVPAYSWNEKHYYYLINTKDSKITRWVIDIQTAKNKLKDFMRENFDHTWDDSVLDAFNFAFVPHSSIYHKGKIYVSGVNSYYIIVLDLCTDSYEVIVDNEMKMISSTNTIIDDHLIYARYSVSDRVDNIKNETPMKAETVSYDLNVKSWKVVNEYECINILHSVAVTPDKKFTISISTTSNPNVEFLENSKEMYKDKDYMRKMFAAGLKKSQIHIHNNESKKLKVIDLYNTPAHIEYDLHDPSLCYISSHSLGVNAYDGFVYSFGKSSINKLHLKEEPEIIGVYEEMDFLRIPSHKLFTYKNKKLIAATVYPYQIHVIDYDTMSIYKKIHLEDKKYSTDFSDGPFKYPRVDSTPFSVHPVSDTPYMYLVGGRGVKLYNHETNVVECVIPYNKFKDPISVLGHSVLFDQI
ncbi:MAG: hypothetical protein ACOZCL_02195 [Bacillota bacterium]